MTAPARLTGPVLLFDGECGLCQRLVRVLLFLDTRGVLRFAPLQGTPAQAYLRQQGLPTEDFDSLVFVPDWSQWNAQPPRRRSDGVLAALSAIGGVGRVLAWSRVMPASWRDGLYRLVARVRCRLFGPWQPRPLARPEWAQRFLE